MNLLILVFACTTQQPQSEPASQQSELGIDQDLLVGAFQSCAQYKTRDLVSYYTIGSPATQKIHTYCSQTKKWKSLSSLLGRNVCTMQSHRFDELIIGCAGFRLCNGVYRWTADTRQQTATSRCICSHRQAGLSEACHADVGSMRPTQEEAAAFLGSPYLDNVEMNM